MIGTEATSILEFASVAARKRHQVAERAATLPQIAAQIEADLRLPEDFRQRVAVLCRSGLPTLVPLLGSLLRLNSRPYTLDDHFVFEPLFRTRMPQTLVLKAARQTAKSTGLAAQGVISTVAIPGFNTGYITPLFEMIRRFSHNYVRPFIDESLLAKHWQTPGTADSVLQRSFTNGSTMYFTYALYTADRARGLPLARAVFDEVQDMYVEVIPILLKAMTGSASWHLTQMAGTPKSFDNPLELYWQDSSQAEFVIRCLRGGCNHWNVPTITHDLMAMIGPWRSDISRAEPGLVCGKCRKPISPRHGRWYHFWKDRRFQYEGYHVPQPIMPHHCEDPEAWGILVETMKGGGRNTQAVIYNEVLAESCDVGSKLVSQTDLRKAACLSWPRKASAAIPQAKNYQLRVLAVDWGGGGGTVSTVQGRPTRVSYTTLAVLGTNGGGRIDCLWGHRSLLTHDKMYEARLCQETLRRFDCKYLVHDYGGAGDVREAIMIAAGVPKHTILPVRYHGPASKALLVRHPATQDHPRMWFGLDKPRSLGITCEAIKLGLLRFFAYDHHSTNDEGLLHDFLALYEERYTGLPTTDVYRISSVPTQSDDFAQACNIGSCMLWHLSDSWPDLAAAARYHIPIDLQEAAQAAAQAAWNEI